MVRCERKWDACLDLTVRRFVYSSLGGAFGGLLLFRSPVSRWASVAFGAGLGIGSAYTECSRLFEGSPAKLAAPKVIELLLLRTDKIEFMQVKISQDNPQFWDSTRVFVDCLCLQLL
ncbi:hypothetical protein Pyn_32084 [Prunus yedoensis var. nudiflora]|uniref:MICOS complex subunit Mic10 n=1 Tax=Prunus yedoensis var. nudiflora TaxID=2094558 RepID=A0A314UYS8_PRUYE|nr:hypothetical protein Pyn_32084 [Prunus yedoensis var. nudiflora]